MANVLGSSPFFLSGGGGKMLPTGNIKEYQVAYVYDSDTATKKQTTMVQSEETYIKLCNRKSSGFSDSDVIDITNLDIISFIHVGQDRAYKCPIYTKDEFEITPNGRIHFTVKECKIRSWSTSDADRIILFCK